MDNDEFIELMHPILEVFPEIEAEIIKQHEEYGSCNDQWKWLGVAGEEFGEISRAVVRGGVLEKHDLRTELIQLTAILLRWIGQHDTS